MRNTYGTTHLTDANTAVQFGTTTDNQRVLWANMKAREGNAVSMYIGGESTVNSTNGFELRAGDALPEQYREHGDDGSIAGDRFWVTASSTTAELDFSMGLED